MADTPLQVCLCMLMPFTIWPLINFDFDLYGHGDSQNTCKQRMWNFYIKHDLDLLN